MDEFAAILHERVKNDRLIGKILSVRKSIPTARRKIHEYLKGKRVVCVCLRIRKYCWQYAMHNNKVVENTASKEYMRQQYTSHAAALKATTIVSSVVMPSAMQNAVEKRILRSLIKT